MSDETQVETKVEPTIAAAPKQAAQPPRALDKLAQRRLEVKKQKRKAHRHKINASNTPG